MKRFAWGKGLALLMIMALALTGCFSKGKGPEKAPEEVVKEAMHNLSTFKSMKMVADMDINVKAIDKEKTGFEKANFKANIDAGIDMNDAKMPKLSMKIDAKGSQNSEKEESGAGEIRMVGNTLYATLTNMTDFQGTIPLAFVQPYFGKWWSIALPTDITKELSIYSKDEKDLTAEEKKLKAIYDGKNLFKNVQYDGNEEVDGEDTYVYTVELDKEAVKTMIKEMAEAQGAPISEEEMKKVDESWSTLTFAGKVYVNQKDMNLKRLKVMANLKDLEGADVDANLTFTYSNIGGEVKVEVPADATEFDLGSLLGGMGGVTEPALIEEPAL